MPEFISVDEFIAETLEDYSSPTTSSFYTKMTNTDALCLVESIGLSAAYFQHHKPCDFKLNPQLKYRKLLYSYNQCAFKTVQIIK
uniref:Uncharacterized protein n=1 Tax=Sinocyclocheilus rhinocerous TaxID=307959 RepID=A0A673ID70_9TELE